MRRNERADSAATPALDLTPTISGFHILTWNPKSINPFTQNGNNAGIISSTINSSRSSQVRQNGDQLSENQEENKTLYIDCTLVIQGSLILSYWNKNNNHSVWPVKCHAPLNTFSWNVALSLSSEREFSRWIARQICLRMSKLKTSCPSWDRQECTKDMMNWNHLILCKQMRPCLSKMLSTKY